ncbi:MAG: hypothetical protein M1822_000950 [Bathelium mastoideum]|nr:MAG: hypothetical protein M1822_000950 [Bathelium mastoideum]
MTATQPSHPNVPILMTPSGILRHSHRVIFIWNEVAQDLGIWSWRALDHEGGALSGTVRGLLKELENIQNDPPGVIIANPGQLLYSNRLGRAVTLQTWNNLPRESAVHPTPKVDPKWNLIPGNKTPEEHARFVFDNVVLNPDLVARNAEIYVVGLGTGADVLVQVMNSNWPAYSSRISALGLTTPSVQLEQITNQDFKTFLIERSRSWDASSTPLDACLALPEASIGPAIETTTVAEASNANSDQKMGFSPEDHNVFQQSIICPTFSCGQEVVNGSIFSLVYPRILSWFLNEVAANARTYKNPSFDIFQFPKNEEPAARSDGLTEVEAAEPGAGDGALDGGAETSVLGESIVPNGGQSGPS